MADPPTVSSNPVSENADPSRVPLRSSRRRFLRFWLRYRDGRSVSYPVWCWLPVLALPFVVAVALLSEPHLRQHLTQVVSNPSYAPEALAIVQEFNRVAVENLLNAKPVRNGSEIPTVRLDLPPSVLERMQLAIQVGDRDLGRGPGGNKPWFKADYSWQGEPARRVKISLRGVSQWHHRPEKPSFRIKLRKDDVTDGRRYVELQRPEDPLVMKNRIPDQLAQEWGMISDQGQVVRVFINRKYFGVYLATMRSGESLALKNGRMPGTFIRGDLVFGGDLWPSSKPWKFSGEELPEHRAQFDRLLETLEAPPSREQLERLASLFDFEVYAKWAAIMIGTGSVHTDRVHNHNYFLASNQGKIEAVIWDANSYGIQGHELTPPDLIKHPIMDRFLRDPCWVHLRNQRIFELLNGPLSDSKFERRIRTQLSKYRPDLESDVNISGLRALTVGLRTVPMSVLSIDDELEAILEYQRVRRQYLLDYLEEARVSVREIEDGFSQIQVSGTAAIVCEGPGGLRTLYPGLSEELSPVRHYPNGVDYFAASYATPAPVIYSIRGSASSFRFRNAVTGEEVRPSLWSDVDVISRTLLPVESPEVEPRIVLGPGRVELTATLEVGRTQTLVIRPGTDLRLGKDVSIFSRGKVLAEGTSDAPITIAPAASSAWGAFGISGESTAGTRFSHVSVYGGGEARWVGLHFKGMLSVYDCPDVQVHDCEFGPNARGDDAVNLAESHVDVRRTRWRGAPSDALDLDQCEGRLVDCEFLASGNDGLDLMGCRVAVVNTRFIESGDKGASVGEKSIVSMVDCEFERCEVGVQLKDASRALFEGCRFQDNRTAVHAYQKKWIYGRGGRGAFVDCVISGSVKRDFDLCSRSAVEWVGPVPAGAHISSERLTQAAGLDPVWTAFDRLFETERSER